MWDVFKCDKPLIGVIHLPPLPGSPRHELSLKEIYERALKDAEAYSTGGMNGLIIENYGDAPFYPNRVGIETVASMTYIATRLIEKIDLPLGINVLRNDTFAALSIAYVVGGKFVRVNVLSGIVITDQGLVESEACKVLRFRKALGAGDVKLFADVHVKHAIRLEERPVELEAYELLNRSLADALIVTGESTGMEADINKIKKIKEKIPESKVLAGSGVNKNNLQKYLTLCDGIIVGTALKKNEITENPVDPAKVKDFVKTKN
ncbi:MAG: BtpA/SgcQ family protein [Candidatus Freyarchaeum deiterrae]